MKLRHPYWCEKPEVKINGAPVVVQSSPASYLSLEQIWKSGDVVDLRLPMKLCLEALPNSKDTVFAIMYGPTVLAAIVPDEPNIPNPATQRFSEHLNARGKTDTFPPLFVAAGAEEVLEHLHPTGNAFAEFRGQAIVKPNDLTLVPFHRIYEEQYAVYFPLITASEWTRRETEILAERDALRRLEADTLDFVTPGYQQPEVEHRLRSENSEIEDFADRKCRIARDRGWFSYEMAVDPYQPVALVVTYWGGVWHARVFDVLIDGEKLATQRLLTDKPGDFFDQAYDIPTELTAGKTKVSIRFQSRPGDVAGGIFGLRLMRASAVQAAPFGKDSARLSHKMS